jgi:hypothetical protein
MKSARFIRSPPLPVGPGRVSPASPMARRIGLTRTRPAMNCAPAGSDVHWVSMIGPIRGRPRVSTQSQLGAMDHCPEFTGRQDRRPGRRRSLLPAMRLDTRVGVLRRHGRAARVIAGKTVLPTLTAIGAGHAVQSSRLSRRNTPVSRPLSRSKTPMRRPATAAPRPRRMPMSRLAATLDAALA